ncbi:prepilin peptidase [Pseudalkalibacillus caeni]|uniref:Prepilin peptidase n=1 Tax=Exobacillus caeni TaxID=2574798 RepID=A0A5R9FI31_9BACL|nr:A24 family peptidase [Pseudalkalibacillus caeni]TLS39235.1 prepilin peptidase [Pseudalkalibacillus caeni]
METLLHFNLFILGLILGSFFNVVGLRIPNKESIAFPASHCPNCQRTLSPLELIPVFSFLFQGGKCKGCKHKISPLYPFIELATASLFTMSPLVVGWSKELLLSFALISLLMIIFVSDITYMIIPDKVLLFFGVLIAVLRVIVPLTSWWSPVAGALIGFGLLLVIAIVSRGGMGGGDIKLFAVIGIVLGWKGVLLAFFFSTLFGSLFGVTGVIIGKVKRGQPMPFGPYIVLGALTAYFAGEKLLNWYIGFL